MPHQHPWEQILNDLRDRILSGDLRPGDQVPSYRDLRTKYEVSETPVKHAVERLRWEGLVETRHGAGVFVKDHQDRPNG